MASHPDNAPPDERSFSLRTIATPDLPLVSKMAREIWPQAYRGIISSEQMEFMLDRMYSTAQILTEIDSGSAVFCWIMADHERFGFTAFGPLGDSIPCEIHKLYVLPAHQGKGAGRNAIAAISDLASRAGSSHLELRVNRHNSKAITFYEHCGFHQHSTDCKEIGGGFVMDDFILRKPLENGIEFSS